ncbi:MAG: histidine kinase [Bacteroidetes bacterium]|nr:histidine kinase [Bacteroidota bacterium]
MKQYFTSILKWDSRRLLWRVLACSVLGCLFYVYLHFSASGQVPALDEHYQRYLLAILSTNLLGFVLLQVDGLLNLWIQWKTNFLLRFLVGFVLNGAIAVALMFVVGKYALHTNEEELLKLCILYEISVFVYEIFYGWFYSYRHYAVRQVDELKSERLQLELQFESLKSQISPHYLFNCLNTISSLLFKDSRLAEEFIRRMADTFRYVVNNQKQQLVLLREELDFVRSYCFLLQVRFEQHLKLEVNLPKSLMETQIPPLALQMLVENAVKHNQISKEHELVVYISAIDNTHISITNTKTKAINPTQSFKVGLDNIRQRYLFFTEEKVTVRDDEKFSVLLPVIKKNTTKENSQQ